MNETVNKSFMSKAAQIGLGIAFLSAALFRIFNFPAAQREMGSLSLPGGASVIVILFELVIAASFLSNRFVKPAALLAAVFLAVPIGLSLTLYARDLCSQLADLFTFDATVTDIVLHLIFLVLLVFIYIAEREKQDENPSKR
jgi:uncharacterized membrane protein YphA (DoxX/SURF4 family)